GHADGAFQRRDRDRRGQGAQVAGAPAGRGPAQTALGAGGLARLSVQGGGGEDRSVSGLATAVGCVPIVSPPRAFKTIREPERRRQICLFSGRPRCTALTTEPRDLAPRRSGQRRKTS